MPDPNRLHSGLTILAMLWLAACTGDAPTVDEDSSESDEAPIGGDGDDDDEHAEEDTGDSDGSDGDDGDESPDESTGAGDGDGDQGQGNDEGEQPGGEPDAGGGEGDPPDEACAVDPQRIFEDVAYFASAELRGRIPGDVGNERALQFAEQNLAAAGLAPGAEGGSFRQPFEFSCGHDWCRNNRSGVAENVIGKIQGSDPALAEEVIIVGAHIDHLGVDDEGAVYGGADDNASGAAIVLELARMFARCDLAPRRTLLFVEWNAEEMGLIGSRHYVNEPLEPLERTIAVYNFDMVGGGDGTGILLFGGDDSENRWLTDLMIGAKQAAGLSHVIELVPQKLASDHAPFVERGIPICWGFARPDPHPGYHTPDDDMSRINLQSLRAVAELFWAALRPLAMGEEGEFLER